MAFAYRRFRYEQWNGTNIAVMRQIDPTCTVNEDGTLHINVWYPGATDDLPVGGYLAENYLTGSGVCGFHTEADLLAAYTPVPE